MEKDKGTIMRGQIIFYNDRGYGFIRGNDRDWYYHVSGLEPGYEAPAAGDVVLFQPGERLGKPIATSVSKIRET